MSDNGLPPASVQTYVLNSTIDASLLGILLLGVYTTIYVGTMYIYLTSKKSRSLFVLSSITILYLVNIGQIAVDWILIRHFVGFAGETREQIYMSATFSPGWSVLTSDIFDFVLSTVADALLIWRCFHAWDGSFKIIALPIFLVIAESACYMAVIICAAVTHLQPRMATAIIMNDLLGAALCTSLGSTMITTTFIIYRIRSVTASVNGSPVPMKHHRHFTNILDLLVQSAAVYAVASLVNAILTVIMFHSLDPKSALGVEIGQDYMDYIFSMITGLAPTVMVARVSLASSKSVTTEQFRTKMSDLNFNGVATASMSPTADIESYVMGSNVTLQREA